MLPFTMQLQDLYKFVSLSVCKILRQSEEISFPSFFRRMLMSTFFYDSRLITSKKCMPSAIFLCGFQ